MQTSVQIHVFAKNVSFPQALRSHTFAGTAAKPPVLSWVGRSLARTWRPKLPGGLVDPLASCAFSEGSANRCPEVDRSLGSAEYPRVHLDPHSRPCCPPTRPRLQISIYSLHASPAAQARTLDLTRAFSSSVTTPITGICRGLLDLLLLRGPWASAAAGASVVGAADSAWRGMAALLSYKVPAAEGLKEALPPGTQGHLRAAFPAPPQPTRGLLLPPPSWLLRRQRVAKGGARNRGNAVSYGSPGIQTTSNRKLHLHAQNGWVALCPGPWHRAVQFSGRVRLRFGHVRRAF